jgi:hypothetical protein
MRCGSRAESSITGAWLSDVSDAGQDAAGVSPVGDVSGAELGFEDLLFAAGLEAEEEMSARMEDENHGDDQTDALEGVKYYLIR